MHSQWEYVSKEARFDSLGENEIGDGTDWGAEIIMIQDYFYIDFYSNFYVGVSFYASTVSGTEMLVMP